MILKFSYQMLAQAQEEDLCYCFLNVLVNVSIDAPEQHQMVS